jgi:hypothetical protein
VARRGRARVSRSAASELRQRTYAADRQRASYYGDFTARDAEEGWSGLDHDAGSNPLIAMPTTTGASPWAGVWIAEDVEQIVRGVRDGSWVDGTLGTIAAGLDGLAIISDPVGALVQYGVAWLIEHVEPLSEALDWLAGDPARISAHAQTWRNVAAGLRADADTLAKAVRWDVTEWTGAAAAAYRHHADGRDQTLQTLARASDAVAMIIEAAGMLVGTVRLLVRDAIATVVSRLVVYAGELAATLGLAAPLVVEQVSTLCAFWAARIARLLHSMIASLRRLGDIMSRLATLMAQLKRALGGAERGRYGGYTGNERGGSPSPAVRAVPTTVTAFDLDSVGRHLARLDHSPANDLMIERIRERLAAGQELTEGQRNFMSHELTEKSLMDRGVGYDEAHEIALSTHPPGKNYDPEVIDEYAHLFNNWWRKQWGLEPR